MTDNNRDKHHLKLELLKSELQSKEQQTVFENIYTKHTGDWSGIKTELSNESAFSAPDIGNLEFTHRLGEWSSYNTNLIAAFKQDDQIHTMRDIAMQWNTAAFMKKVKDYAPAETEEEKQAFARHLHRELFQMEPTALLINMIKDPQVPLLNDAIGAQVGMILEKHPEFNIKTTSVYEILNQADTFSGIPAEYQEPLKNRIKTLQRITALSPDSEALPVLYNMNFHSAHQISELPRTQFIDALCTSCMDDSTLAQIHTNAERARARNEQTIMALREMYKGTGIAMIDKSLQVTEQAELEAESETALSLLKKTTEKHNLSWDLLFGDADFGECDECSSVYSPASYYVELLEYLRNNNLGGLNRKYDKSCPTEILSSPYDFSDTPLDKLFKRRPDLGCLELTCQNINTLIPYIDLVNEVMENYVAFKKLKPFNVADESSSELLAEPQHTEYQAYCLLKNEVYPFNLPYHQPIDAERIYLEQLGTSRYELMETFRKSNNGGNAEHTRLNDEVLGRAADAEYLGITLEEYIILTKESFISKDLVDKLERKSQTDDEYRKRIGVKEVFQYYGYDDERSMLDEDGLALIKREFLRRTGIDYISLVELLKTGFINPNLPRGKSKVITDSLHFSYRFLQNYAKAYGLDRMASDLAKGEKLAHLMPILQQLFTGNLRCSITDQNTPEISEKDIIQWIKCEFYKVGKMIVIENGKSCLNGRILGLHEVELKVDNCMLSYSGNEQIDVHIGTIDKQTGKVLLEDTSYLDLNTLQRLTFISDRGEKGIFLPVKEHIYLNLLKHRDTGDLSTARLQHLDGTALTVLEYDRIHRFIRLWRKLGWTIRETDQAIAGLGTAPSRESSPAERLFTYSGCEDECGDTECMECEEDAGRTYADINSALIHQLVPVKKLLIRTALEPFQLLPFWTHMDTEGNHSLYRQLFLTYNIIGSEPIFVPDQYGNVLTDEDIKLSDYHSLIMAALGLKADHINDIMSAAKKEDKLTVSNLSVLYRYRLLSDVLDLDIPEFLNSLPVKEQGEGLQDIFLNAYETYMFVTDYDRIEPSGFTSKQLSYIIKGLDDDKEPLAPTQLEILKLAKGLYDALNIIEEENKDIKAARSSKGTTSAQDSEEQATSTLIRTKMSLLGTIQTDIIEKIIGLLEGTNIYTTSAPKKLSLSVPEALARKLKYEKKQGTLSITGILTKSEITDYHKLSMNEGWLEALTSIQKQQAKLFKELLTDMLKSVKTIPADRKKEIKDIIMLGDVSAAPKTTSAEDADTEISVDTDTERETETKPETAPLKRIAFLEFFMPYLRQQLTRNAVMSTLAEFAGLEAEITDVLVSHILRIGDSAEPIYSIFENIKRSAVPASSSGYLVTANTDYTFIVKSSNTEPFISINDEALVKSEEEAAADEWWSEPVTLQAGKLYLLKAKGVELENLFWKTTTTAVVPIPPSALIPDFASEKCTPALVALKKAAVLVSTFKLSADEIRFFELHNKGFDELSFHAPQLKHWLRLEDYVRLRNSLPQHKLTILEFWKWIYKSTKEENEKELIQKIADLTTWKHEHIQKLTAPSYYNLIQCDDYRDERSLLKLQKAVEIIDRIGVPVEALFTWAEPVAKFNEHRKIADSIKNALRARTNRTDWEQVAKPLHDKLRNHQKEALTGYLLQQKELIEWNVTDADGLFEYFLIDVQMDACMETSRIKQAISSVQLFVQRCFLGLEEEHSGIKPGVLDRPRWDWMQRYRVWEANRKVFLYPENWIESNLRDDKSPFFKELESELLQADINKQNITDALKSYLYKVDEIANMEVVGLYVEGIQTKTSCGEEHITEWCEGAKLHVFSRTQSAPYVFYYRYLALDKMYWYPWEKMQVDIPSYDVEYIEPETGRLVSDSGCYVIPVVWNKRLIVFFPQIMKKTVPNEECKETTLKDLSTKTVDQMKPSDFYEIKLAWSEHRNGKWTQKQVSNDAVVTAHNVENKVLIAIQHFKFIPIVEAEKVTINIDDAYKNEADGKYKGAFEFNGTSAKVVTTPITTKPISIQYFNQTLGEFGYEMHTWQVVKCTSESTEQWVPQYNGVFFYEFKNNERIWGPRLNNKNLNHNRILNHYRNFHHPDTQNLLGYMNIEDLKAFFKANQSLDLDFGRYQDDVELSYHELKGSYSLYNWELFFHTPVLLADALSKAQQFEEAAKWFHYVFNPIAEGNKDNRFWQFKPFSQINSQRILDSIFNDLKPNTVNKKISEWRDKPFMPHLVARSRPVAYMKWAVMKYIDNLVAWGDQLFRQDTIETINQATQLYVLAGHILGPRPMMIPRSGKIKPQTYLGLLDKWDAFGNALVELELSVPFSNQIELPFGEVNHELVFANLFGLASSPYFCIPNNPKLMGYWDTLADRLFKIRHCQNIEGVFRKLALFEPPIDPALLVKAAAQGLSIASVLNDLNAPMPNYRFYYLLQKALELCNELKSLGSSMLSAIEKKDNEALTLLRAKHEGVMLNLMMEIKKKQLEEAQKNVISLQQNRTTLEARMKYYLKLTGMEESLVPAPEADFSEIPNDIVTVDGESGLKLIPFEKEDMDKASAAAKMQSEIGKLEALASTLHVLPAMNFFGEPLGVGGGGQWGYPNVANATSAIARHKKNDADELSFESSMAGKKAGFTRAMQERTFQANAAGYELKQLDKQITTQEIRMDMANQEITNQQKSIDNAMEVEEFIKNKYSSEELYHWTRGSLKTLYRQVYDLAYDLAKKAEKTYCFERGITSANFIQPGYFDAGRDGLLSGEQLYVGLKQLEAAYQNERGYDYEVTKQISLYQLNPLSVIQLRETGKCEFALPEIWFDMDYPGHYKRRIKSVSLTIPCIAGPYTGINAKLSLLENKFRNTAIGSKAYEEKKGEPDLRFSAYLVPIQAIAASSAQNDSGMFELNFKDERYLPFEGAGVISKWRLELPSFRQYDYGSISDVIMHLKFTASEGGEQLKSAASEFVWKQLKNFEEELSDTGLTVALSMRHDLPNEWFSLTNSGTVKMKISKKNLPYSAQKTNSEVVSLLLVAKLGKSQSLLTVNLGQGPFTLEKKTTETNLLQGRSPSTIMLDIDFNLSIDDIQKVDLEDLYLVMNVILVPPK